MSDIDYWTELASDKPLTTTAQPAGPRPPGRQTPSPTLVRTADRGRAGPMTLAPTPGPDRRARALALRGRADRASAAARRCPRTPRPCSPGGTRRRARLRCFRRLGPGPRRRRTRTPCRAAAAGVPPGRREPRRRAVTWAGQPPTWARAARRTRTGAAARRPAPAWPAAVRTRGTPAARIPACRPWPGWPPRVADQAAAAGVRPRSMTIR